MKPAKTKETCATGHTFDDIEQTVCACGTVTRLPLQPAPSPAERLSDAEFERLCLEIVGNYQPVRVHEFLAEARRARESEKKAEEGRDEAITALSAHPGVRWPAAEVSS